MVIAALASGIVAAPGYLHVAQTSCLFRTSIWVEFVTLFVNLHGIPRDEDLSIEVSYVPTILPALPRQPVTLFLSPS